MTWAERVGDLARNTALTGINFVRLFTVVIRVLTERIDGLIVALAERGEEGIKPTEASARSWLRLPTMVAWGVATIVLRAASIATVFTRQVATTSDEFLRHLAEESAG
jgi:hypothetical protein